jgi:hypothetical protein
MLKKTVFIASAGSAKGLASELKKQMEKIGEEKEVDFWEIHPWFDEESELRKEYGPSILEGLIKECKLTDLAVILLTGDDLKIAKTVKEMVPRDNCIFEAGLFMGGLGLERNRCVIATTVDKDQLPVDLQSVHYIRIDGKATESNSGLREEMRKLAKALFLHSQGLKDPPKRPFLPFYSAEELFKRERPENEGGDIVVKSITTTTPRGVVVNSFQPVEIKVSLAKRVFQNMEAGIEYFYFFRAETFNMVAVAGLIQALVLARLGAGDDLSERERLDLIGSRADDVEEAIERIQKKLFIHLLPKDRLPLHFCVHNASKATKAKCYLRYPGEKELFIPWGDAATAYAVADDLLDLHRARPEKVMFYPTAYFDLYKSEVAEMEIKSAIDQNLSELFSDEVYKRIKRYFFG